VFGGLHLGGNFEVDGGRYDEKYAVQQRILGTNPSFALGPEKTVGYLIDLTGRRTFLINIDLIASIPALK
jgi:hypothetical protein